MKAIEYLQNPRTNKGTAFTEEERSRLGLEGLLPPVIEGMEQQVKRVLSDLALKPNDLEKYIYLVELLEGVGTPGTAGATGAAGTARTI